MDAAEFDKFADEYLATHRQNIRASGEEPEFFHAYKIADVRELWRATNGTREPARILDFGTGIGNSLAHFRRSFPSSAVVGVDVSSRSLDVARARQVDGTDLVLFDGVNLPFESGSFDLAFAACVFHHIDHAEHGRLLAEIRRVLNPGGMFVLFEHNPFNPLTVRAVRLCPFDENARLIRGARMRSRFEQAGFAAVALRYRLFFPGPLRALRPLERGMTWLPLGAQYSVLGRAA